MENEASIQLITEHGKGHVVLMGLMVGLDYPWRSLSTVMML